MNEGVLNFSLGLASGGFISKLGEAKGKLLEFAAAAVSVDRIFEGFKDALETGVGLKHLSDQTGETVASLYQLEEAFQTVGVPAQELPNMLVRMNQALSGLGRGSASFPLFARMGLDVENLKRMGAAQQIESIATGLSKLDKQSAVGVSSQLFGMETGARPFLQIIGSIKEFQSAMADSRDEGNIFATLAPMAERLDATFIQIKGHLEAMFAGVATGFMPMIQAGADFVNNFARGLQNIGQQAGRMVEGIEEAFKEGKISELLTLTFSASVEFLVNAIAGTLGNSGFWSGIWEIAVGNFVQRFAAGWIEFASLGQAVIAGLDTAFQKIFESLGRTKAGKLLGLGGFKAESFSQNFEDEKKKGQPGMDILQSLLTRGTSMVGEGMSKSGKAVHDGFSNAGGAEQDKLKNFWAGIMANVPKTKTGGEQSTGTATAMGSEKYTYHPEFTALNKMGFVGMGNASNDAARQTADNTRQMVSLLQNTVNLLTGKDSQTNSI